MSDLRFYGAIGAFYMALAYAVAIVFFLVVLDYANMTDPADKVALLLDRGGLIWGSNLLLYVFFAPILAVFVLAMHDLHADAAPGIARVAMVIGIIWAGLLIASGLVANAAIGPITALHGTDPAAAIALWSANDAVANGLGGGAGEVAGGLMTLLFGLAGLRSARIPNLLAYLGLLVGAIGLISSLPGLHDLGALFGITQIFWFAWSGIVLIRG